MSFVITRCGANVNMRGPEGETALHLAAAGGHHEVVKFLLNEGADADIQDDVSIICLLSLTVLWAVIFYDVIVPVW